MHGSSALQFGSGIWYTYILHSIMTVDCALRKKETKTARNTSAQCTHSSWIEVKFNYVYLRAFDFLHSLFTHFSRFWFKAKLPFNNRLYTAQCTRCSSVSWTPFLPDAQRGHYRLSAHTQIHRKTPDFKEAVSIRMAFFINSIVYQRER